MLQFSNFSDHWKKGIQNVYGDAESIARRAESIARRAESRGVLIKSHGTDAWSQKGIAKCCRNGT